jgi:hypothetical protein
MIGAAMGIGAMRRLRDPDAPTAHRAAVLLAVIVATAVCGVFDAVLLLAPPTLFFWATAGLLLPETGPVIDRPIARQTGLMLFPLMVGVVTTFGGRSVAQLVALVGAGNGRDVAAVRRASIIDPGNFRLQLIQATRLRCNLARPHARQAVRLYPHHPSARRAASRCGSGTSV